MKEQAARRVVRTCPKGRAECVPKEALRACATCEAWTREEAADHVRRLLVGSKVDVGSEPGVMRVWLRTGRNRARFLFLHVVGKSATCYVVQDCLYRTARLPLDSALEEIRRRLGG